MKRFLHLFIIFLFVLNSFACSGKQQAEPGNNAVNGSQSPQTDRQAYDPDTDFDNRFASIQMSMAESDELIFFRSMKNKYTMYYDKAADDYGVLCAKPECLHNEQEENHDCTGYVGRGKVNSLSLYQGKLYYVAYYHADGSPTFTSLFRINPDASGKEKLLDLSIPEGYAPQEWLIHRGRLYMRCVQDRVINAMPIRTVALLSSPITESDIKVLYEYEINDTGATWSSYLRFIGDRVYLAFNFRTEDEKYITKVICCNADTGECTELLSDDSLTEYLQGFWVKPDGTMYFLQYGYDPEAKLWKSENNGALIPFAEHHDSDGRFIVQYLCSGVIFALDYSDSVEGSTDVWLRDFEGNTLYKGLLTTGFINGTKYESWNLRFSTVCGDRNAIYVSYLARNTSAAAGVSEPYFVGFLVRYTISENGLEEKLLIIEDNLT